MDDASTSVRVMICIDVGTNIACHVGSGVVDADITVGLAYYAVVKPSPSPPVDSISPMIEQASSGTAFFQN